MLFVKQLTADAYLQQIDSVVKDLQRKRWKKAPDKRLGDYLREKRAFKEKGHY